MGWRDRAAGHVALEEADWAALDALPKDVAFQVRSFSFAKRTIWLIGTRSNLKKWRDDDDPFVEFAPAGSPKFAKLAATSAASFYAAFDAYYEFAQESDPDGPSFGPAKEIGELSLGVQLATLLEQRILSLVDDDDYGNLACISEAVRLLRVRSETPLYEFLFEKGITTVTPNKDMLALVQQNMQIDLAPLLEQFASIDEVRIAKKGKAAAHTKLLGTEELDAFVKAKIADSDTVFPDFRHLPLVAQRAAGGKVRLF